MKVFEECRKAYGGDRDALVKVIVCEISRFSSDQRISLTWILL